MPPPIFHCSPCHVFMPRSLPRGPRVIRLEVRSDQHVFVGSGSDMRATRSCPLSASSAVSQPRTPNSPPLFPTSTLPLTTSGAMVIDSPRLMSPSFVFQTSFPVLASTRDRLHVERVVVDPAVVICGAAIHHIAAGDALRAG